MNIKNTKFVKVKKLPATIKFKVFASFNNLRIDLTDENGNVIYWKTAGTEGFKNSKKNTPFAACQVANKICSLAVQGGAKEVLVEIYGIGIGRDAALKSIIDESRLSIYSIEEIIKLPHNGTRPRKQRK